MDYVPIHLLTLLAIFAGLFIVGLVFAIGSVVSYTRRKKQTSLPGDTAPV